MKYLVVANQTLGGEQLIETVRFRQMEGAAFHVVVPATEPRDQHVYAEGDAREIAQRRLDEALARFRDEGADVTGEVGDPDPLEAIDAAANADTYSGLIISTLPSRTSRWLKVDLPTRAERHTGLPVQVIEHPEDPIDLDAEEESTRTSS